MAKATKTIRERLNYQPQHAEYFAANQALFNRVVAFYFDLVHPWCSAPSALCEGTQIAMPAWSSANASLPAPKNLSRKSLMLLCDVQGGWRNPQVLPSPRKPNAKRDHLSLMPGMETTTRMAPRKKERSGWMSAPQLFLPHYACHWSRGYAPCLRQTTTEEWQKPLGFNRSGVSRSTWTYEVLEFLSIFHLTS